MTESKKMRVGAAKFDDDEWVTPDYEKMFRLIEKKGLKRGTIAKEIGKTSGYLSAMKKKNSRMQYGNLRIIAKMLGLHGATKLMVLKSQEECLVIDDESATDQKADSPTAEPVTDLASVVHIVMDAVRDSWEAFARALILMIEGDNDDQS